MNKETEKISVLLERFFAGQTTDSEERELYRFFRQETIPEEFAPLRPVFAYFDSGLAEELGQAAPPPSKRKLWIVWGSVAASILLILFASLFFISREPADPFEGSYIIRNGVRITDLTLIRPELEATLQQAILKHQDVDPAEICFLRQTLDHYNRILDSIENEEIRNEVAAILFTNY